MVPRVVQVLVRGLAQCQVVVQVEAQRQAAGALHPAAGPVRDQVQAQVLVRVQG